MVFYWSLSDSKSPQVSRTLLGILADLSNTIVSMVSAPPLISSSSSSCTEPLKTIPRATIVIGMIVTFIFPNLF